MKKIWLIIVLILCIGTLLIGRAYWNHRIDQVARADAQLDTGDLTEDGSANADSSDKELKDKIKKLPDALEKAAKKATDDNGQVQIAMVGGGDDVQALSLLLQHQLDQTYGVSFFKVTALNVGSANSLQFNQSGSNSVFQNMSQKPDAVIFIPLIYNDDHKVSTDDTEAVTGMFEEKVRIKYPDAAFFVSPPNYSSNASYINDRIDGLKTYVEKQKIEWIDYLSKWPQDVNRKGLVGDDGHTMNKDGQKIWLDYISDQWGLNK